MDDTNQSQQTAQTTGENKTQPATQGDVTQASGTDLRTLANQSSQKQDDTYVIPEEVAQKSPDLVELIKSTTSMNFEERQYWFQILPIMTPEQIEKLRQILIQEKEQLQKLDESYASELKELNDKHLIEWEEFQRKKSLQERQQAEGVEETKEHNVEEELLKKLQDI